MELDSKNCWLSGQHASVLLGHADKASFTILLLLFLKVLTTLNDFLI